MTEETVNPTPVESVEAPAVEQPETPAVDQNFTPENFEMVELPSGKKFYLQKEVKGRDMKRAMDLISQHQDRSAQFDAMLTIITKYVDGKAVAPDQVRVITDEMEGADYITLIDRVQKLPFLAGIMS